MSIDFSNQTKRLEKNTDLSLRISKHQVASAGFPNQLNIDGLNNEQAVALERIIAFLQTPIADEPILFLTGKPGTGKTFLLKRVLESYKRRAVLTAPTNKATKVLKHTLTSKDYEPQCCTIHSLLKLQMTNSGEIKELVKADIEIDLSRFSLLVIDEAYMINEQLKAYIEEALEVHDLKLIILGDSYQLPPVHEDESAINDWLDEYNCPFIELTEVMRHKGHILEAVDEVRAAIDRPYGFKLPFLDKFKSKEGLEVKVVNALNFWNLLNEETQESDSFLKIGKVKVVAWKNKTVDRYNHAIKLDLFPMSDTFWNIGDRITLTAPAKDLDDKPIAIADEEGTIEKVCSARHAFVDGLMTHSITALMDDNKLKTFSVLNKEYTTLFESEKAKRLQEARSNGRYWKEYWKLIESIHYVRHGYAITAHRAQGSTYEKVFVDLADILQNPNRKEALRCLNVAMSRAQKQLIVRRS